jgi:hypothetical protein
MITMSPLILVCLAVVAAIVVAAVVTIFGFSLSAKRNPRAR